MSTAILMFVATAIVGGLAMLAQWARKSRGAEITLIVVLLFLSLLAVGFGALVGLGLLLRTAQGGAAVQDQVLAVAAGTVAALVGLVGGGLCVPPLLKLTGSGTGRDQRAEARNTGGWWSDPPVFFALWVFVQVLAYNVFSILTFALAPEEIGSAIAEMGRLSPGSILITQVPYVAVALMGVGLFVRRDLRASLARLGYGRLSLAQLGVVALFVAGAYALFLGTARLFSILQPDLHRTVGEISSSLFDPTGLSPVSAVLFALLIGVGAGLGEETLFRGAVQPVLGIPLTSVLFASTHVQYGPSLILGYIFLTSVGLGLLRRHINTSASFLAHSGYNTLGVLLTYFLGVGE